MSEVFLRVEKGTADPDELAALATVLYARLRAPGGGTAPGRSASAAVRAARWHRLERHRSFTNPRAWSSRATR